MSIRFISGDLFQHGGLDALAHGCNCAGAMGKGIATVFKKRFPRMYAEYRKRCRAGEFCPGDVFPWEGDSLTVYNLGTQKHWRTSATLDAIEQSLRRMVALAEESGIERIGLPRIGAGLGGLDWTDVKEVMQAVGEEANVELVVFEHFEPTRSRED